MFNSKKMLLFVILAFITMSISNAELKAFAMWLEVDGEYGYYDVTGEHTLNGDGTITLHPPWEIKNADGGQWSKTKSKTFKIGALQKIVITSEGLQLSSPELLNISILDLSGKSIYSASGVTDVEINKNTMPLSNAYYILRTENEKGLFEFITFMLDDNLFMINK